MAWLEGSARSWTIQLANNTFIFQLSHRLNNEYKELCRGYSRAGLYAFDKGAITVENVTNANDNIAYAKDFFIKISSSEG